MSKAIALLIFLILFLHCQQHIKEGDAIAQNTFTRLEYNNPELVVDLGVGLWAWPLPLDYDRDGDMDLIVSCPDVPYNGIYFFENTTGNSVTPFFEPSRWLAPSKKNLQISYVDDKPYVFGPGILYRDFVDSLFNAPEILFDSESLEKNHQKIRFSQWKLVDYEDDGDLDLIAGIDDWGEYGWDNAFNEKGEWTNGPLHGFVYLIENRNGEYKSPEKILAGDKAIDVYGAPSPNINDFDGDGDLDLICGEFLDRMSWFENIGTRKAPKYDRGRFLENENGLIKMDLEMITPSSVDWDQDGDIDLIVGDEDGRVALIENTGEVKEHMPVFESPVYLQQKAGEVKFGALVTPVSVDWDDDGDEDLICGNTAGYIGFVENLDGGNPPSWNKPQRQEADDQMIRIMAGESGSIQGPVEQKWGYTTLSVADWDNDGLMDIVVNSIWGKIEWFRNTGTKGNPRLTKGGFIKVHWGEAQVPKPEWTWWTPEDQMLATQWRTTPVAIDWNQDGMTDLISLDHEGYLSFFERFHQNGELMLKPGNRIFYGIDGSKYNRNNEVIDLTTGPLQLNTDLYGSSGRRKWCFTDWDQDGDQDILINSTNVAWFENVGQENEKVSFVFHGDLSDQKLAGHTTSPTTVDWDKNGKPDLLLGAEDGFFYYLPNDR